VNKARGGAENPLGDGELREKYRELATPILGAQRTARIEQAVDALAINREALQRLLADVLRPPA